LFQPFQRLLIALFFVFASLWLSFYYQHQLPEEIPTHFNARGNPDRWQSRTTALVSFPAFEGMIAFLYLLSSWLIKNPKYQRFKFKTPVSESQKKEIIANAEQMIDILMICSLMIFLDLQWESFRIALGRTKKLSPFLWIITAVMLLSSLFYTIKLIKISRPSSTEFREAENNSSEEETSGTKN